MHCDLCLQVNPIGEDSNKPVKLSIYDAIPIISMDGSMLDEKSMQKNNAALLDKEKEDKNILNSLPVAKFKKIEGYEEQLGEAEPLPNSYIRFMERSGEELDGTHIILLKFITIPISSSKFYFLFQLN